MFQSTQATNNGAVLLGSRANEKGAIQGINAAGLVRDLLINPDGGKVGIGTTAPTQALTVNGTIESTAVRIGEDPSNRTTLRYVHTGPCPVGSVPILYPSSGGTVCIGN
jgi:hypothetical protein